MAAPTAGNPSNRDEERLVKLIVKAHNKALDFFRKGAAAAKDAGDYLHELMLLGVFT